MQLQLKDYLTSSRYSKQETMILLWFFSKYRTSHSLHDNDNDDDDKAEICFFQALFASTQVFGMVVSTALSFPEYMTPPAHSN